MAASEEGVMFGFVKIAGVSAVLAAGVVAVLELSSANASVPVSQKAFSDRILPADVGVVPQARTEAPAQFTDLALRGTSTSGKGDRLRGEPDGCAAQVWPNIERACLVAVEGTPVRKAVRTITIETREGANVSVLATMPVTAVAGR